MNLKLFTYSKIPVYAHISTLILIALITFSITNLVIGLAYAFIALSVILLHEFGHALAAQYFGCKVERIVLMAFGGVAMMQESPKSSKQHIMVLLAGPAVNFVLGALALGILGLLTLLSTSIVISPIVNSFVLYFLMINLLLSIFNMLPVWPLDGGQILRIALAMKYSDKQAVTYSWYITLTLGIALIIVGVALRDILLILIMAFLLGIAFTEYRRMV